MIICETEFETPDPDDPAIALCEVDYYAWIPRTQGIPNHRLSLRKRLTSGQYEVYRRFAYTVIGEIQDWTEGSSKIIQHKDTGYEQIIFTTDSLQEAVDFANAEAKKYHGPEVGNDRVCTHSYPNRALGCKVRGER